MIRHGADVRRVWMLSFSMHDSAMFCGRSNNSNIAFSNAQRHKKIKKETLIMLNWLHKYQNGVHHYDCPVCDDGYATRYHGAPSAFCQNCGTQLAEIDAETKEKIQKEKRF